MAKRFEAVVSLRLLARIVFQTLSLGLLRTIVKRAGFVYFASVTSSVKDCDAILD